MNTVLVNFTIINIANFNVYNYFKDLKYFCEDDYPAKCTVKLNTVYVVTYDMS